MLRKCIAWGRPTNVQYLSSAQNVVNIICLVSQLYFFPSRTACLANVLLLICVHIKEQHHTASTYKGNNHKHGMYMLCVASCYMCNKRSVYHAHHTPPEHRNRHRNFCTTSNMNEDTINSALRRHHANFKLRQIESSRWSCALVRNIRGFA